MKRPLATILLAALSAIALSSASCATRKVEPAPKVAEIPAQSFARQWSLDLGLPKGATVEWVRSAGDFVIAFTNERRAYVIRKDSGRLVTIHEIQGNGDILPPIANKKLIGYPLSTTIEVFNLEGKRERTLELGVAVQTTGAISDSTVYIGVSSPNGGRMRAIDPANIYGTPRWELLAFGTISSTPVFFDQSLYFATNTGRVYAVNEKKAALWPLEGGFFKTGPVLADLAADDFAVYAASTDTKLVALNRINGKVKWQYFAGEPLESAPIPFAENVYLPVRNQGLVAIAKTQGEFNRKPRWTNREATKLLSEDNKYVYVRLRGNALGALDKTTGAVAFRSGRSDLDFFLTNTNQDALIYGATKSGYILAARPVTKPGTVGELLFTTEK